MALGIHETCELNELLVSCTNSINTMGLFLNQCQDAELKSMIQKHMAAHVQDYNMKVEWATKATSQQKLNVPPMPEKHPGASMMQQPKGVTPDPNVTKLDDRAMATSYLLTLKRAGREYAWATFECCDPQLRAFLEDAFTMCSHHAFEIAEWMTSKGWYPAEQAPTSYLQKLERTYQPVREMAAVH